MPWHLDRVALLARIGIQSAGGLLQVDHVRRRQQCIGIHRRRGRGIRGGRFGLIGRCRRRLILRHHHAATPAAEDQTGGVGRDHFHGVAAGVAGRERLAAADGAVGAGTVRLYRPAVAHFSRRGRLHAGVQPHLLPGDDLATGDIDQAAAFGVPGLRGRAAVYRLADLHLVGLPRVGGLDLFQGVAVVGHPHPDMQRDVLQRRTLAIAHREADPRRIVGVGAARAGLHPAVINEFGGERRIAAHLHLHLVTDPGLAIRGIEHQFELRRHHLDLDLLRLDRWQAAVPGLALGPQQHPPQPVEGDSRRRLGGHRFVERQVRRCLPGVARDFEPAAGRRRPADLRAVRDLGRRLGDAQYRVRLAARPDSVVPGGAAFRAVDGDLERVGRRLFEHVVGRAPPRAGHAAGVEIGSARGARGRSAPAGIKHHVAHRVLDDELVGHGHRVVGEIEGRAFGQAADVPDLGCRAVAPALRRGPFLADVQNLLALFLQFGKIGRFRRGGRFRGRGRFSDDLGRGRRRGRVFELDLDQGADRLHLIGNPLRIAAVATALITQRDLRGHRVGPLLQRLERHLPTVRRALGGADLCAVQRPVDVQPEVVRRGRPATGPHLVTGQDVEHRRQFGVQRGQVDAECFELHRYPVQFRRLRRFGEGYAECLRGLQVPGIDLQRQRGVVEHFPPLAEFLLQVGAPGMPLRQNLGPALLRQAGGRVDRIGFVGARAQAMLRSDRCPVGNEILDFLRGRELAQQLLDAHPGHRFVKGAGQQDATGFGQQRAGVIDFDGQHRGDHLFLPRPASGNLPLGEQLDDIRARIAETQLDVGADPRRPAVDLPAQRRVVRNVAAQCVELVGAIRLGQRAELARRPNRQFGQQGIGVDIDTEFGGRAAVAQYPIRSGPLGSDLEGPWPGLLEQMQQRIAAADFRAVLEPDVDRLRRNRRCIESECVGCIRRRAFFDHRRWRQNRQRGFDRLIVSTELFAQFIDPRALRARMLGSGRMPSTQIVRGPPLHPVQPLLSMRCPLHRRPGFVQPDRRGVDCRLDMAIERGIELREVVVQRFALDPQHLCLVAVQVVHRLLEQTHRQTVIKCRIGGQWRRPGQRPLKKRFGTASRGAIKTLDGIADLEHRRIGIVVTLQRLHRLDALLLGGPEPAHDDVARAFVVQPRHPDVVDIEFVEQTLDLGQ